MRWPEQSPDLKPIEQQRGILKNNTKALWRIVETSLTLCRGDNPPLLRTGVFLANIKHSELLQRLLIFLVFLLMKIFILLLRKWRVDFDSFKTYIFL